VSKFFKKKTKKIENKIVNVLGPMIIQISVLQLKKIMNIWSIVLDDYSQLKLYVYFNAILIAVFDRLLTRKMDYASRGRVINIVIDTLEASFCKQEAYGKTIEERKLLFNKLFDDMFKELINCESVMGEGENVMIVSSQKLFQWYLPNEDLNDDLFVSTVKEIGNTVVAMISTDSIKKILD